MNETTRAAAQSLVPGVVVSLLRWTGVAALFGFYRHLAINLPRSTTATGVLLLLGVAAIRAYLLIGGWSAPTYLMAYFALLIALALVASAGMVSTRHPALTKAAWALGAVVAAASLVVYIVSRVWGLPALPQVAGRWDYPLGTFSMAIAVAYLGLHLSLLSAVSIASPGRRDWHD